MRCSSPLQPGTVFLLLLLPLVLSLLSYDDFIVTILSLSLLLLLYDVIHQDQIY